ncbi:hypothetical protein KJZ61_03915 [Candidatus Dependentiae bacterium]|nr:hypothetical protein [Candidatus Dependentiae bacterium]
MTNSSRMACDAYSEYPNIRGDLMKLVTKYTVFLCTVMGALSYARAEEVSLKNILDDLHKEYFVSQGVRRGVDHIIITSDEDCVLQACFMRQTLLGILEKIDAALIYWRQQRDSSLYRMVDKGLRALSGVQSHPELADVVIELEQKQQEFFQKLGRLDKALAAPQKVVVQQVYFYHHRWIIAYEKYVMNMLASLQKPTHLQRHWPKYVITALGMGLLGVYAYRHRLALRQGLCDAYQGLKRHYHEHAVKPLKELWGELVNREPYEAPQPLPVLDTQRSRDVLVEQFRAFDHAQREQVADILHTMFDSLTSIDEHEKTVIREAIEREDIIHAIQLVSKLDAQKREELVRHFSFFKALRNEQTLNQLTQDSFQTMLLDKFDMPVLFITSWLKKFMCLLLQETWEPFERSAQILRSDAEDLRRQLYEIKKSQKTNLILSAMIPTLVVVGGVGYGLTKLVALCKHRAKDFRPLRETLGELAKILIYHMDDASRQCRDDDADRGHIVYLCAKLRVHIGAILEKGFTVDDLMRKIDELKDPSLTVQQRLRLIDNLRSSYWFLHYQPKVG